MKVVLLAGGFGSRISEESQFKPKPMIEIGGMPILWHIMKEYAYYGYTEFIICAGYKQEYIKEWFANYFLHNSDVTFDYRGGSDKFRINVGGQDAAVYGGNTAAANQTGFHAFTPPLSVSSETLLP